MAILITGGAGYIGSHTCVELLNNGQEIVVADNFSNSKPEALNRVQQITGKTFKVYDTDLLDKKRLTEIFLENRDVDAVIHFAGLKAVGESVAVPLSYYRNNIIGTLALCEVMQEFAVKNLVFSSSATVYGATDHVPITEDTPLDATNPYGRTKVMIEHILRDIAFADPDWSIASLRYFNPVGAHESGLIGEDPHGIPNNLMPFISQVAIEKRKELQIFGKDYNTRDGTGIRDYIHVVDLAKGHLKALDKVSQSKGMDAYNLGTGKGLSVLDMVIAFENAANKTIPFRFTESRPGDVAVCYADPTKAGSILGWQAERGADAMCRDTWRWQRNNPSGYDRKTLKVEKAPLHEAMELF